MQHATDNRRRFIGQTLGAAVLPAGSPLQSFSKRVGPNDMVRVGVIGTGGRGRGVMKVFLKNPEVSLPVICDVNQLASRKANREILNGRAEIVEDYRRILDRKDIDAVLIATPDHWHAIPTIHACQAGKDVYVEKPMSYCIAEGRRMAEAARKYSRVVQAGTQQLSGPHYIEATNLVQSGKIGKVTHVCTWNVSNRLPGDGFPPDEQPPETLNWDFWLGPAPIIPYNRVRASPYFRMFWDYSGGTLTDWGTHHVGSVHHVMGEDHPLSAVAMGGKFAINDIWQTPDTLHVLWEYAGGWTLEFALRQTNSYSPYHSGYGIVFYGADATLYLDRSGYELIPEKKRNIQPIATGQPRVNNFLPQVIDVLHVRNFLDCMRTRRRPNADVEIGHRATLVPHLGNIALRTGRKITWNAERETIVGDPAAAALLTRHEYRKPYVLPEV